MWRRPALTNCLIQAIPKTCKSISDLTEEIPKKPKFLRSGDAAPKQAFLALSRVLPWIDVFTTSMPKEISLQHDLCWSARRTATKCLSELILSRIGIFNGMAVDFAKRSNKPPKEKRQEVANEKFLRLCHSAMHAENNDVRPVRG
jgi:hypothetical protein